MTSRAILYAHAIRNPVGRNQVGRNQVGRTLGLAAAYTPAQRARI